MFLLGRAITERVLVLISDGASDNRNNTWFEAMRTRNSGINIITVNTVYTLLQAVYSFNVFPTFISTGHD